MLTQLQIRDFAIVEQVELDLGAGFTALTGETGAGKSILVDALMLAVGGRADSGCVRHGSERTEITSVFDVAGNPPAVAWLAEQSIEHEGECVLRRVVGSDGRSRAYVNGRSVAIQSLRELGALLVDVHGQLEFQSLTRRGQQRRLLDEAGGLGAEVAAVGAAFQDWRALSRERDALEQRSADREARLELLSHYVAELDALDPKAAEVDALHEERQRISAIGRLAGGAAELERLLGGEGGAEQALGRAQSVARPLLPLDPALQPIERLLEEAAIACREALGELGRYATSLEAEPGRLEAIESRLAALESVARKHRVEPEALAGLRDTLSAEHDSLRDFSTSLAQLERRLAGKREDYRRAAERLSAARRDAAKSLDAKVSSLMQQLGMPGGVFETRLALREPPEPSEYGADEIEFRVAANPGQPAGPLAKVASGGELSRISLALQVATLSAAHLPSLVFDEVDAGVGGAVAEMVGRQLRALADAGQVLCVTHLPQVACQAGQQVRVSKLTQGGTTLTRVEPLGPETRIEEIARMLGGARITERTREHAREMLQSAGAEPPGQEPPGATSSRGRGSSRARSARAGSTSGRPA
jgi:DNA repair protein RecN (Recombination protein N)